MPEPKLEDLPNEILSQITSILPIKDAGSLSQACVNLRRGIGWSSIQPGLQLAERLAWSGASASEDDDVFRMGPEIPTLFGPKTHSIKIRFKTDYRSRRGETPGFYIVSQNSDNKSDTRWERRQNTTGFDGGRVIATKFPSRRHPTFTQHGPLTLVHQSTVELDFLPKPGETYRLWVGVGRSSMKIYDVKVLYFIQGDVDKSLTNAVSFLHSAGLWRPPLEHSSFHFCQTLVETVTRILLTGISEGRNPDPFVAAWFQLYNIDNVDEPSLKALQAILPEMTNYFEREDSRFGAALSQFDSDSSSSSGSSEEESTSDSSTDIGNASQYDPTRLRYRNGWDGRTRWMDEESDEESEDGDQEERSGMAIRLRARTFEVDSDSDDESLAVSSDEMKEDETEDELSRTESERNPADVQRDNDAHEDNETISTFGLPYHQRDDSSSDDDTISTFSDCSDRESGVGFRGVDKQAIRD